MIFSIQTKKTAQRHDADKVLASEALERFRASDANCKKKIATLGVAGVMKA